MTKPPTGPLAATFLDLPAGSPGGSVERFLDLYTGDPALIPARAFMLAPAGRRPRLPRGLELLPVAGRSLAAPAFGRYVHALRRALTAALDPTRIGVLHLQHLTFGATPALMQALPAHPRIALVHGPDLICAGTHREQLRTLRESVRAAHAVVVPTAAMADLLLTLAPTDRRRIAHIPWGVPDHLLTAPPARPPRTSAGHLRLLYAGRLATARGAAQLAGLATIPGVELSLAVPAPQFRAVAPLLRRAGVRARYLGHLRRPQLWRAFAEHDVLVKPATAGETMGLVTLEAQACGLPVLYQPVPGLAETLSGSGMPTDFTHLATLTRDIERLRSAPGLLPALRRAGRTNAARRPLSATARALDDLSRQLT